MGIVLYRSIEEGEAVYTLYVSSMEWPPLHLPAVEGAEWDAAFDTALTLRRQSTVDLTENIIYLLRDEADVRVERRQGSEDDEY